MYRQLHVLSQAKAQKRLNRNYYTKKHFFLLSRNIVSIMYGKRKLQLLLRYDMDVEVGRYAAEMAQSIKRLDSLSNPKLFPDEQVPSSAEH